jgi:hypothetical protein
MYRYPYTLYTQIFISAICTCCHMLKAFSQMELNVDMTELSKEKDIGMSLSLPPSLPVRTYAATANSPDPI